MRFLSIIPQEAHGIRLWISPLASILRFLLLCCFFDVSFLSTFSCTGNVNVSQDVIPTGDQVKKLLSALWKRNAELLNLLHVVEKVRSDDDDDAGDGNIVVLQKKSINDDVDNVLVSQLLIKATYFLYGFNYLFCDVKLCVVYGWRLGKMMCQVWMCRDEQYCVATIQWCCVCTCSAVIWWMVTDTNFRSG